MINQYIPKAKSVSFSVIVLKAMFLLLFSLLFGGQIFAQTMSTCGNTVLLGGEVLKNANPAPITGHVNNGSWTVTSGLTIDDKGDPNSATDHELSGFTSGTYTVVWRHTGGSEYTVDITVHAPVEVTKWAPSASFDPCGAVPFQTPADIEITGGVPDYYVTIGRSLSSDIAFNFPPSSSIGLGSYSTTMVATIKSVVDANGCEAVNVPLSTTFSASTTPLSQDVNWTYTCEGNPLSAQLVNSEAGITYELRRDGIAIETLSPSPGGSQTFNISNASIGSYEIYAINICGGADVPMNGGAQIIYSVPVAYNISIVEAAPYCSGNTYTVRLSNTENGVIYTLYNPSNNAVTNVTGTGSAVSFTSVVLTAGTYSVKAIGGSCADVPMNNTISIGTIPIAYNVTGGTLCEGSTLIVGLSNSMNNVNYTLIHDDGSSVTSGQVLSGTNSSLSFNAVSAIGTYWVEAEDVSGALPGCRAIMSGMASITALPKDLPLINQGVVCPSGEVKLGSTVNQSDPAVTYTLLRDGNPVLSLSGNNGELTFGAQTTAGTYTVRASSGGCSQMMTGTLQVLTNPVPVSLTTNKDKYCSSDATTGVVLSLGPVQSVVDYQLERFDGTNWISYGGIRKGNDGDVITWTDITEGTYRVVGSNAGGCSQVMNGTVTITVTNPPTADVLAQAPIRRCENVPGTFNIEVVLTGNPPYNFTLKDDKGATIATVTGHPSNNYTIIVNPSDAVTIYSVESLSDAGLCSPVNGSSTGTVYVDPVPNITFSPANPMVCEGSTIDITANGAGLGGTYTWSDGLGSAQTITVGPNPPGKDYTVIATSVHSCTNNELVHVTVNTLPIVDFTTPGDIYEYCENNGIVQLTGTPGGGSFVGSGILGDQFDPAAANIGSNYTTYNFTSVEGCTNSITKEIVVNEVPVVRIDNLRPTYCSDAGTVSVNGVPDGTAPGSFGNFEVIGYPGDKGSWWDSTDGAATLNVGAAITALGSPKTLTFRYTYTDPKGCTAFVEESTTLLEPVNNNIYFIGLSATCEQDPPVTLVAYFRDNGLPIGEGTYTGPGISDNRDGTAIFTPSDAGSGSHTVTYDYIDANGCSGSYSETITIGVPIDIAGLASEYCSADNGQYLLEGGINGNAPDYTDGTTFDVYYVEGTNNVEVTKNAGNGTYYFKPATLANTPGLGLGDYEVTYRYNASGCNNSTTSVVKIVESVDPTFLIGTETVPSTGQTNFCENSNPAILKPKATLPSTAGSSFSGNGVGGNYFVPNDASVVFKPTPNTITHTVRNIVNGLTCLTQSTRDVYVTQVDVAISGLSSRYCTNSGDRIIEVSGADATDGTAVFTATQNGSSTTFLSQVAGEKKATIKPSVGAGIYEVTMKFTKTSDGCETTVVELVEVFAANPVTFSGVADGDEICQSSAEITLRGDMPNGGIGNFVEDAPGISNTGIDDLGNTVIANDGVGIFTPSAMPLTPYTITYEYTNADGCTTSAQKTIDVVGDPSTLYSVTGGGAYCDDATDKGVVVGLSGSNTGVIYELLLGGLSLTPKVLFDGNGTAFNFTKNQDGTGGDQLFDIEGYYTVSAIQNNCDALMTGSVLIEQYELVLQEESKVDITCIGADDGTVTLKTTGGSGAYEYSIDGGTTWQSSNVFSGLTDGTYQFSVKEVTNPPACEKINTLNVTIVEPTAIVVLEDATQNIKVGCTPCTGGFDCEGSATITVTGGNPDFTAYPGVGYKIQWSTGGTDLIETGMPVGSHSVIVTDGNNCSETINVDILANDPILLNEDLTYHKDNVCNGAADGIFVVKAQGGSGTFQFNLSDPALSPSTWVESNFGATGSEYEVFNLSAALHNIWVRDKNPLYQRCITQIATPIAIKEPASLGLSEESQLGITCNTATDGSFVVRATGGSGTYNFTMDNPAIIPVPIWLPANNGADGYDFANLGVGIYSVWVQDGLAPNCSFATVNVQLADVDPLGLTLIDHTNVLCHSDNTGRVEVLAKGGSGNYVYSWSDGVGIISSDPFIENQKAGIYTLTITDTNPNSCAPFVQSFTITEPVDLPSVINISIGDTDCAAQATGSISLKVVGGTGPYEIIWSNNVKNVEKIENLNPGTYTILVKDANGCVFENSSNPFVVGSFADITLERAVSLTHNNCFGSSDGTLNVKVEGGSGNYEFRLDGPIIRDWTPTIPSGTDEFTFNNLPAGGYILEVRDVNNYNCSYTLGTYTITEPSQITLSLLTFEDVDCFGSSTGNIEVEAKGGSGEYDYSLDNGATWLNTKLTGIHKFTNLSAGTYYIKVRDYQVLSCESNSIVTQQVAQPQELKIINVKVDPVSCFSANDGTITVTGQGGSGNYDYYCVQTATWQGSNVFNLPRGNYSFIIQEQSLPGCASAASDPVEMTSPLDFTTTPTPTDVKCFGANNGIIAFETEYSNGSGGIFQYSIDNEVTWHDSPISNVPPGLYTVIVKDVNNGCKKTLTSDVRIIEPSELTYTEDFINDITCFGHADGEIKITAKGGTGTIAYQWSGVSDANGGKTNHVTNLSAADYSVSITDDNGCFINPKPIFTVADVDDIVASYLPTHIVIGGQSTGSIVINTISGGPSTTYSVVWDDGSTGMSRTGLAAGDYSFTVTSDVCTKFYEITLIDQSLPLDFDLTPIDAECYGYNGNIELSINSGNPNYDITWFKAGVEIGNASTANIIYNIPVVAGNYEVTVKDNVGAELTKNVAVYEPKQFNSQLDLIQDIECFGDNGTLSFSVSGNAWVFDPDPTNYMLEWTDPDGLVFASGTLAAEGTQSGLTKPGPYKVVVYHINHTNCDQVKTINLSEPSALGITHSEIHVSCNGGSDGSISVIPTGRPSGHGFTYSWRVSNDGGITWGALADNTSTISNKPAAFYEVTVQSTSSSCSYTSTPIEITEPGIIMAKVSKEDIITCYGDNSGIIQIDNITGGTMPYKYFLNGVEKQLGNNVNNETINGLISQSYSVVIKDSKNCESILYTENIVEPAELIINVSTATIDCDDANSGSLIFTIEGGRLNASGNQTYGVTVSPDGKAPIVIGSITNTTGGAFTVNSPLLQNLNPNDYTIKVIDLESNEVEKCEVLQGFSLELINVSADLINATCFGVNNGSISNVIITGTSANYDFTWTSADGTGFDPNNLNQSGLSEGTYTLRVTDNDRGGCVVDFDFVIDYEKNIEIEGRVTDVVCSGESSGAITIENIKDEGTNTTYLWSGPPSFVFGDPNVMNQAQLEAGGYSLSIETTISTTSGSEQCKATEGFTVNEPGAITFNSYFELTSCDPYERTLKVDNVKGGSGAYDYKWTGPPFNPVVPVDPTSVLIKQGGDYAITIKDKNLCEEAQLVSVPLEVAIDPVINGVNCNGGNSGSIILNVSGGSGVFNFAWTGPDGFTSSNRNIDNLYAGDYNVTITDANESDGIGSCSRTYTRYVPEPSAIIIDPTVVNTSCFGKSDGQIEIEVSGGVAPYTYKWSPVVGANGQSERNQYNLPADTYTITATDAIGCNTTINIDVLQDDEIILTTAVTETICDGTGGAIDLTVVGGSGDGFSYNWSSADGSGLTQGLQDQSGLTGGTYTVVVSDSGDGRKCTATVTETITHTISIVNEVVTPVNCLGNNNGAISFDVIGGDRNYTYSWVAILGDATRIVDGDRNQSGLSEGTYEVTITDGRKDISGTDCAITKQFNILATNMLDVSVAIFDSKMCFGENTGRLEATVTGGSDDYTYKWNGVVGTSVNDAIPQGIYQLEVIDNVLGCSWVRSYEVKGPLAPLTIDNIDITNVLCFGEATGAIDVTVSGGTVGTGYTYTWSGASTVTGANPTGLVAGIYKLTVTDDNDCEAISADIEITQPASHIKIDNPVISDVSTVSGSDGQIQVDINGGTSPYSLEWFDASNASVGVVNPLSGISSGTYRIVAIDNNGCSADLTDLKVVEPGEALGFAKVVHQISPCTDANNGELHITRVYGGIPIGGTVYRIQVNGPGVSEDVNATNLSLENLSAGNYLITITDANSVVVTETVTIINPVPLTVVASKVSDIDCYSAFTGEIEVVVNGGIADAAKNYFVEIVSTEGYSNSNATVKAGIPVVFSGLPAGNFTITVKDHASSADTKVPTRGNCEASDYVLLTQPHATVELTANGGVDEICNGEDFTMAINTINWDFSAQGNFKASVYDGFTTQEYVINETPFNITVAPSTTRNYEITKVFDISSASCLKGDIIDNKVTLIVNQLPQASLTGPSEVCADGTVDLTATLAGEKPFTITWIDQINGTSNTDTVDDYKFTFADSPIGDAQYQILNITDNNTCSNAGSGIVNVDVNDKPVVTLSGSTSICVGQSTALTLDFEKGNAPYTVTYTINGDEGTIVIPASLLTGTAFTWDVTPGITSDYEITALTDGKGCAMDILTAITARIVVNQLPERIAAISSIVDVTGVCQGLQNVDYSVKAVAYATNYVWTPPIGVSIVSGNGTTNIVVDIERDFTGGYLQVYAQNACGNGIVTEKWITADLLPEPLLIAPTGPTNICEGQTGLIYNIIPVANATAYEWDIPTGLVLQGDGTGTSILVNTDPNVSATVGDIKVRPLNTCSTTEPWSPVLTVTLTALPIADAGNDERICDNEYTLNAAPANANEIGEWKILKGSGQFINNTDKLLVNPTIVNLSQGENIFQWTVKSTITNCETADEVIINNDQLTVTAIVDQTPVCGGEATVNGTPVASLVGANEGSWSFTTGSGVIEEGDKDITKVSKLQQGSNILRWTVRKGACESFAEVEVVNDNPTESIIYDVTDVKVSIQDLPCQTTVTSLRGSTPMPEEKGYWRIESGQLTIDDINSTSINITDIQKGDHILSWNIIRGGCASQSLVIIRNNSLDVDAGINNYTCDATYILDGTAPNADNAEAGFWTTDNGAKFVDASVYNTEVTDMGPGDNVFRWTLTRNGCQSFSEVIIRNDKPADAAIVGDVSEIDICGDEVVMVAVPVAPDMGVGAWSIVSGSGTIADPLDPNTKITGIGQGENVFRWTVALRACQDAIELTVTNLKVVAYAGVDQPVCSRTAQLNANEPDLGEGEWNVVPGEGEATFYPDRRIHNPSVGGLRLGDNKLVWTVNNNGCISRDTVVVSANIPTPVNAGADQIIPDNFTNMDALVPDPGCTGVWSLVEGGGDFVDATLPNTRVNNVRRGNNIYRWTVSKLGCSQYDEVVVTNGSMIEADAGIDQDVCEEYTILEANDPNIGIGEWTVKTGTGYFDDVRDPKTKVSNISYGENVFVWTIYYTNGSTSDEVIIKSSKPSNADAGLDARACSDEFVLDGKPPVNGVASWTILSGGGVFENVNDAQSIIRGLAPGENILKLEISEGECAHTDTVSIFNDTPSIADGGPDQIVCVDSVEMKPVIPKYGIGSWRVIKGQGTGKDGGEITGRWIYNLAPGENQFEWVVHVPGADPTCISSAVVTIINNKPSDSFAGRDRTVCVDNVMLSGSEDIYGNGTWELLTGAGTIDDPTNKQTQVTGLGKGMNRFRWTVDNEGCTSESEVVISYDLIEAFAGFDIDPICADTVALAANEPAPGVGSWSIVGGSGTPHFTDADGNSDVNNPYATVRDLDRGENKLVWTIQYNSCVSSSEIIVVNNMPSSAVAGDNVATCNNSITLGASNSTIGTGVWTIQNGGGDFVDVTSETTQVNNLKFGKNIFRWTVSHEACSSSSDVEVSYNKIDADITQKFVEVCTDETILSGNNASPGIGEWSVISGNSQAKFDNNNNPTTRVYDLARGTNRLQWRIEHEGCVTTDEVEIINHNPSTAYAGSMQELCVESTILRATNPAVGTGTWSILSGKATIDPADLNKPVVDVTNLSKGENKFLWTVTSANGMCSSRDEVSIYNNVPSTPYAGEDDSFCSPSVTLKAATPDYGEGLWSITQGGGNFDDATLPGATITNLQEGVNKFVWTISVRNTNGDIGCSESDEVTIINDTPTPANAGPDIEDCKDFALLDANVPTQGTGVWTTISGNAVFADISNPKTRVDGLTFGENVLQWKIENGNCTSVDEVVIFNKVPTESDAGIDKSTCDDYYPLNANTPLAGVGVWTVVSGKGIFDDANDPATVVRGLGLGENKLKWTITYGGCATEDVVIVESNKADPYAGEDDISYESSYALNASNPGSLGAEWSVVAGSGNFDDKTYYNTDVSDLTEGINTFRWTMDVKGCITYDDVSIDYRVVPNARFEPDVEEGCVPLKVKFTNHSTGGYAFHWDFGQGDGVDDNTTDSRNAIYTFRTPGVYTVSLTVLGPDGENGVYTQDIVVHELPTADFNYGPDVVYAPNGLLDCRSLSIGAIKHNWDFGDGNYSDEVNPRHKYADIGTYTLSLEVESEFGCMHDTTIIDAVVVKNEGFLAFPTAFTPRSDGGKGTSSGGVQDNSVFKPVYKDVEKYKLQIFNRWGQLIYESTDIDEGWSGFFNNQLSPQAVYVWKASGVYNSGRGFNNAGSVLLVR